MRRPAGDAAGTQTKRRKVRESGAAVEGTVQEETQPSTQNLTQAPLLEASTTTSQQHVHHPEHPQHFSIYETVQTLRGVPIIRLLEERTLEEMARSMHSHAFNAGETILEQGSMGKEFFIIASGKCVVSKKLDGGETLILNTLKPGEFFGEASLTSDCPRAATVTARGGVHCLVLSRSDFQSYIMPKLGQEMREEAFLRDRDLQAQEEE